MITGFMSSRLEEPNISYGALLLALRFDLGVAENLFAKLAKRGLRTYLEEYLGESKIIMKEAIPPERGRPLWTRHYSVALRMDGLPFSEKALEETDEAVWVECLVESLAKDIKNNSIPGKDVELVNALRTKIQQVGQGLYQFTVIQQWRSVE